MSPLYPSPYQNRFLHAGWLLVVLLALPSAVAQPVSLDQAYGVDGRVVLSFPGITNAAYDLTIQTDDKVLAVGAAEGGFSIIRLRTDGAVDPTFATGGESRISPGEGFAIERLSNGKIFATGRIQNRLSAIRLTETGAFDSQFASNGLAQTPIIGTGYAVAAQPGGLVVTAGVSLAQTPSRGVVVRFLESGALDPSFGTNGLYAYDASPRLAEFRAVGVRPEGRLVLAGFTQADNEPARPLLVGLTASGALDPSFGTSGTLAVGGDAPGILYHVEVLQGGAILAAGSIDGRFAVVRITPEGALDSTFGTGGIQTFGSPDVYEELRAMVPLVEGGFIAGGTVRYSDADTPLFQEQADFVILRLDAGGAFDPSFGTGGSVVTGFSERSDRAFGLTIQSDNKVVVGGWAGVTASSVQMALARYTPTTTSSEADPEAIALRLGVYPNPAVGHAILELRLSEASPVRVAVYDMLGREVARPFDGFLAPATAHQLPLRADALPAGVYVVRVTAGAHSLTRRLTVVR